MSVEVNSCITDHELDFLTSDPLPSGFREFKIGTCTGLWGATEDCYFILSIANSEPGNGHFNDILQWFEHSCRRDKKNFLIIEIMNPDFFFHLLTKRGFIPLGVEGLHVIKVFELQKYKTLLRKGNALLDKNMQSR